MNKTYLIYGLALIILTMIYISDDKERKPNFTQINADHLFLEKNKTYKTTINDSFNNDSLKDHITLVFFGYASCPDFCPDTLAKMNKLFKIWLYALGSFSDKKTQPYDRQVVIIRSFWILLHIVTCVMIIIGNGRLLDWW